MNIYLREIKAYRKSLLIWCVSMILFIASGMGKYTSISNGISTPDDLLKSMPKSIQALIGGGYFDLGRAIEYFGAIFLYLMLMAAIHASMLGTGIISKEERDKTVEFLMVKPVSRNYIITAKLFAALTNIIVLNLVTLIFSIIIVGKYSMGDPVTGDVAKLMTGMFFLQLLFMMIGAAFAAASKKSRAAGSITTTVLLTAFILSMIIDINENLEWLKFITPFKYFDARTLLLGEGFSVVWILLTIAISSVSIVLAYIRYNKRDLSC